MTKILKLFPYLKLFSSLQHGHLRKMIFSIMLLSFFSTVTAQNTEKEERWFEVEVILFKMKSEDGLFAESWKDDAKLILSEDVIDFLQPYEATNPLSKKNRVDKLVDSANTDSKESVEQGFVRLPDDLLQLTSEASSIKRQYRYKLLEHFSWRQAVDSRRNATKIRIAGGSDYKESFEYTGEKKIKFDLPKESNDQFNLTGNKNTETNINRGFKTEPKALDWVPEIDGEIKIYIHRNYLHVDTNLVYRKPGEVPVDIYHFDEKPLGDNFGDEANINLFNTNESNENIYNSIQVQNLDHPQKNLKPINQHTNVSSNNNNIEWKFDSDFLNKRAEKLFTQKLLNYPLIQERRVRSGELHYFDHPLIGMLVMIRPYEIKVFEDELIEAETQDSTE